MPAYNAGKYILEAVNSVLQQSYTCLELVIVNDGSTDDTAYKLESISDSRVKVFHQKNAGQCAAANKAYSLSSGSLIKFFDADDVLSPHFIASQVATLNGQFNAIAFGSWGRFYNDDLNTFKLEKNWITTNDVPFNWLIASMSKSQVMLQCGLWLIPRHILDNAGLWNEELSLINDFEFMIRVLLCADELRFSDNAILYYRSGIKGSLSSTTSAKAALSAYDSVNLGTQYLLQRCNTSYVRQIVANHFKSLVYSFYPIHKELTSLAEKRIAELGGTSLPYPAGGYTKILSTLLGWKTVKLIKQKLNIL
ncbi:glycosyltransferase family 2 protein [Mucilaginibacter pallidiroseus]|uniref:Glycosyltransferase family 2 protein n=1 Tax=Mucilaginibacter pallidiroseus TaxID=2599295 RepID=A0A563U0W0_9SPHI|nr:glycosyltransferase family A protein [Mucilaginibacter pallidiroseus]TWR25193.1 glycosyltransferase family 2 protein [Mucilaginibacter pallidiroseus]